MFDFCGHLLLKLFSGRVRAVKYFAPSGSAQRLKNYKMGSFRAPVKYFIRDEYQQILYQYAQTHFYSLLQR